MFMTRLYEIVIVALISNVVNSAVVYLKGGGATFASDVLNSWHAAFTSYRRQFRDVYLEYDTIGSGAGIKALKDDPCSYNFVATNQPVLDDRLFQIPVLAGSTAFGFNLPGITSLVLSRLVLVGIFNGTIRFWNDSEVSALNPNASLPFERILVIVRSGSSGTTDTITRALSRFSEDWRDTYGVFSNATEWNKTVVSYYGVGMTGVAGLIKSLKYTFGYLDLATVLQIKISFTSIKNSMGKIVIPSHASAQIAVDDMTKDVSNLLEVHSLNAPGPDSYPIVSVLYFMIYKEEMCNCDVALEVGRYLDWIFEGSSGIPEDLAKHAKYAMLSSTSRKKVLDRVLERFKCKGMLIDQLIADQKYTEWLSTQTWRIPIAVLGSILGILMLIGFLYCIRQQIKLARAIQKQDWLIPASHIKFAASAKQSMWNTQASTTGYFDPSREEAKLIDRKSTRISKLNFDERLDNDEIKGIIGKWKDNLVCLKEIDIGDVTTLFRNTMAAIIWMKDLNSHSNVQKFFGMTMIADQLHVVRECCMKGNLRDVIQNAKFNFDFNFKFSLIQDIANGMQYLHSREIVHGFLRASACGIDHRWSVKVGDWEFMKLYDTQGLQPPLTTDPESQWSLVDDPNVIAKELFWTSPELLRSDDRAAPGKPSDIYSFGVVVQEVFTRQDPFAEMIDELQAQDIIEEVKKAGLRPMIREGTPPIVQHILTSCWDDDASKRPFFSQLLKIIGEAHPSKKTVLDTMVEALETYVLQLEEKIASQMNELADTMASVQDLLHQVLPKSIACLITEGTKVDPCHHTSVTILMTNICKFNHILRQTNPHEVVDLLNDTYLIMDVIADRHDVRKIESIADASMYASGVPEPNGKRHAEECAICALDFQQAFSGFRMRDRNETVQIKQGIHTGPVLTAVVGLRIPHYCVLGQTVVLANRIESTAQAGRIHISESTFVMLKSSKKGWQMSYRGNLKQYSAESVPSLSQVDSYEEDVKTYWLIGKEDYNRNFANMVVKTYCGSVENKSDEDEDEDSDHDDTSPKSLTSSKPPKLKHHDKKIYSH